MRMLYDVVLPGQPSPEGKVDKTEKKHYTCSTFLKNFCFVKLHKARILVNALPQFIPRFNEFTVFKAEQGKENAVLYWRSV